MKDEVFFVDSSYVQMFGSLGGVWLSFIESKRDGNEYFHYPQEKIKQTIGISISTQTRIIKKLKEYGVIEIVRKGTPAKQYYHIDYQRVEELWKTKQ